MASCPNTSAFEPSSLVTAFHSIPHVDIDLNPSPDSFEFSLQYFQAVIIWACVPILVVVCLFILMAVYFICICCCCCCTQHEKRSKASKGCCGVFVMLLIILSLGMVGVGIWAEFELSRNVLDSFRTARNATDQLQTLQNTTVSFDYGHTSAQSQLRTLEMAIRNAGGVNSIQAEAAAVALSVINNILNRVFMDIQTEVTPLTFGDVDPLFATLDIFELARHWAVVGYLIFNALILVLAGLSLCCSTCCRSPICMVIMLVFFFFVTFVMWVAVGGNLALLMVSGDICFAPDALIRNVTTILPTPVSSETLDYYLICNSTCYPSPFQPLFDNATVTFDNIMGHEDTIQMYITTNNPGPPVQMPFSQVESHFSRADGFVSDLEAMASCTGLNDSYLSLLNSLCSDGYLYSLILFAMACGIAVSMVLILICGSFYAGLLSEGKYTRHYREYDDETVVYDFPNQGTSPWDSYGTQQHYTAYRESFDMRQSPQELNPPKYADLQSGFNGNQNGAVFADDGTVGVSIRPASGADGHIDIGDPIDP